MGESESGGPLEALIQGTQAALDRSQHRGKVGKVVAEVVSELRLPAGAVPLDPLLPSVEEARCVLLAHRGREGPERLAEWLRERCQVIILSDTFYEFAAPLMRQLSYPTLFCNQLEVDRDDDLRTFNITKMRDASDTQAGFCYVLRAMEITGTKV